MQFWQSLITGALAFCEVYSEPVTYTCISTCLVIISTMLHELLHEEMPSSIP